MVLAAVKNWFGPRGERTARKRRRRVEPRQFIELAGASGRTPPPHIVSALREVDPTAELHYMGLGVWVLGSVRPFNRERYQLAVSLLDDERERPKERQSMGRFRIARLHCAGFRFIDYFLEHELWNGKIVRDFRFADWRYRHCPEEAFAENMRGSDDQTSLEKRLAVLLDYNDSEARSVWAHAFAGRRSFLQPGLSR